MSQAVLMAQILARSKASEWEAARLEWELRDVAESEGPQTCLCGHYPIHDLCQLANSATGAVVAVGNCCVKRFIGLPSDAIFQGVKRVRSDPSKSLGAAALDHAVAKGWIQGWERALYQRAARKGAGSEAQAAKKSEIDARVLAAVAQSGAALGPGSAS